MRLFYCKTKIRPRIMQVGIILCARCNNQAGVENIISINFNAEEDWGEGLKVLSTFIPELCKHKAKTGDVIHYHYVGRLGDDGTIFGRR